MIKFFRRIRQKLIVEGNLKRYLVYSIGEVLLVMIGILLALQVNNWNEKSKERKLEIRILEGIRSDLRKDSVHIENIIYSQEKRLVAFKAIDSGFELPFEVSNSELDSSWEIKDMFHRGPSFRSSSASFNSMISEGQASLVKNHGLLKDFQVIYTEGIPQMLSFYDYLKEISLKMSLKWSREIRYPSYDHLGQIDNKNMIADLNLLHSHLRSYSGRLKTQQKRITNAIQHIDVELSK